MITWYCCSAMLSVIANNHHVTYCLTYVYAMLLFRHTFGQPCHFMDRDAMEWLTDEGIYKVCNVYYTTILYILYCIILYILLITIYYMLYIHTPLITTVYFSNILYMLYTTLVYVHVYLYCTAQHSVYWEVHTATIL
jgi:hypothetical protein